uniref:Uncharacterized protein n=1 Tax=Eutreptiella gymnastica TaxID=73025 RepID=A0A7S4FWV8_9EUGL
MGVSKRGHNSAALPLAERVGSIVPILEHSIHPPEAQSWPSLRSTSGTRLLCCMCRRCKTLLAVSTQSFNHRPTGLFESILDSSNAPGLCSALLLEAAQSTKVAPESVSSINSAATPSPCGSWGHQSAP